MLTKDEPKKKGYAINGRALALDIFRHLKTEERSRLLGDIQGRDPQLAKELSQESFSFEHMSMMADEDLIPVFELVPATLIGLAIKKASLPLQKKILRLLPREEAKKAFEVLNTRFTNEAQDIPRARSKILTILFQLKRNRLI